MEHQDQNWTAFAIPRWSQQTDILRDGPPWEQCRAFQAFQTSNGTCKASNFDNLTTVFCQDGYVYDDSVFSETVVSKWDLVCTEKYKAGLLGLFVTLGNIIGSLIGGWMGDKIGRKRALFSALAVMALSVILGGISPNFSAYAFLRLLSAACTAVSLICGSVMVLECFTAKHRVAVSCLIDMTLPVSQVILAGTSYYLRDWSHFHLAIGVYVLIAFGACVHIPESFIWLVQNGGKDRASHNLQVMAARNGMVLDEDNVDRVHDTLTSLEEASAKQESSLSVRHMFGRNYLACTIMLLMLWPVVILVSFSVRLNDIKLSGDVFLNYILKYLAITPISIVLYAFIIKIRYLKVSID